jgi:hypothetical protein
MESKQSNSRGSATLFIEGKEVWTGGSYDTLTNSGGVDFDVDGIKGHVFPLGIPQSGNKPQCKVTLGDYVNLGIGNTDSWGLPGNTGMSLDCIHDWDC